MRAGRSRPQALSITDRKEKMHMIYTLEKRHEFGGGTMSTYYGLFKYEKRYANGTLTNGVLVKRFGKKNDALKYCDRYNIATVET